MKKFSVILKYLSRYRGKIVVYLIFNILSILFGLISLGMLSPFLTLLLQGEGQTGQAMTLNTNAIGGLKDLLIQVMRHSDKSTTLLVICLLIIITTILKNLFYYWSSYISSPIRSATITFLRNDLYDKILALPIGYFTEQRKGDLISRMTNDIYEIESSVVSTLEGMIKDPLTIIGYLAYMVYLSPWLSLFLLILLPLTGFLIGRISRTLKRQSKDAAIRLGESLSVLDETLGGIRVIKGFGAESVLRRKFIQLNDSLFHTRNKMNARRDLASPLTETLGIIILTIILYYGGMLIFRTHGKGFSGGDLMTYIAVFGLLINPAKNLSTSLFNIQRGAAAIERVEDLLKAPVTIQDDPHAKKLEVFRDRIEFRGVNFSYEDASILQDINLVIEKGKTIALVGSSGAGKSTLADLVPRFHDVTSGELLIDGINIKAYSLKSVREQMSIVTQEPILFNDTIAANIALGKQDATQEEIEQAAKIANAHNFIIHKEEGYQTNIGDRGSKLSGGERQRLTIARALLKNPPILILDEATSSLDTESERLVQDAINKMMEHRTSIVIAHRLSTIRHADEIIVLQKGQIVERGTHDELIARGGFYKKLVEMQEVK
ncbi:ABC transporter ATP-binding protein [Puia dinghuensis]|uniref:ABC transporter ATP-binding protein n=1 Tax=Puia dinghuensis TaxID=1792502 RepID=A0A8J2UGX7_9BACT|nr:ABC transporter ATP-binding protein [Puia dinghuensis]GGB13723.1 ABC transporter ATP-binding protein [Puia dinghuensis]